MTDLPPGNWSGYLVGAWWPAPPNAPTNGEQFWSEQSNAKEREAVELQDFTRTVSARNGGLTTEDELIRLRIGYNRLVNAAEHCRSKSVACKSVAAAVTELRRQLRNIASRYNSKIDELVAKNTPEAKGEAIRLIATANSEAGGHSAEACSKILVATQEMFDGLGIEGDARRWLEDSGAKFGQATAPLPTVEELGREASAPDALPFPFGTGDIGEPGGGNDFPFPFGNMLDGVGPSSIAKPGIGNDPPPGSDSLGKPPVERGGVGLPTIPPVADAGTARATGPDNNQAEVGGTSYRAGAGVGAVAQSGGGAANKGDFGRSSFISTGRALDGPGSGGTNGAPSTPSAPTPGAPGGVTSGGAMPPPIASAMPGFGAPGGSPEGAMSPGLATGGQAQAFASGMPGGPSGPGGSPPPLSPGGPGPAGLGQPPQLPPSPPVTPMAGGALGNLAQLASSGAEAAPAAPAGSAAPLPPAAPPPVTAGSAAVPAGPFTAPPVAPSGPLPGYGADLRPAAAAIPTTATAPAGPAGPAVQPAPGSAPAPGGPAVAPAGRPSGVGGQSGASVAGGIAAGSTAGAGAGTAARRLAEHQDLQRKVDAVARQAPHLAWAVGLRDDETTVIVATDLASGWIPPTVLLPQGLTLLDPAQRRRDTSAVDLLGAVIAAVAHHPNTYVGTAGPEDPIPGSGERARFGHHVDELGPTLIDLAGTNSRLPRIVQTVARAVARRSGVADNEIELFRQVLTDTEARIEAAYPHHAPRDIADWMLLAAIDALIDGSQELAGYHLAWYQATAVRPRGVTP